MASYFISDIHGALKELESIIKLTGFRNDGNDELYLLGDYGDWGTESIETFGYVMDLDSSQHVHCLMGNHDQMFLDAIRAGNGTAADPIDYNWYINNNGRKTWDSYSRLKERHKKAICDWLSGLQYSIEVELNGTYYIAAHAYPYFGNRGKLGLWYTKEDAIWKRIAWNQDPFSHYHGRRSYTALISGHTITAHYRRENGTFNENAENTIFFGPHFIDMDCGAKCFEYADRWPDEARRARLAALRLDDMQEFYLKKIPDEVSV